MEEDIIVKNTRIPVEDEKFFINNVYGKDIDFIQIGNGENSYIYLTVDGQFVKGSEINSFMNKKFSFRDTAFEDFSLLNINVAREKIENLNSNENNFLNKVLLPSYTVLFNYLTICYSRFPTLTEFVTYYNMLFSRPIKTDMENFGIDYNKRAIKEQYLIIENNKIKIEAPDNYFSCYNEFENAYSLSELYMRLIEPYTYLILKQHIFFGLCYLSATKKRAIIYSSLKNTIYDNSDINIILSDFRGNKNTSKIQLNIINKKGHLERFKKENMDGINTPNEFIKTYNSNTWEELTSFENIKNADKTIEVFNVLNSKYGDINVEEVFGLLLPTQSLMEDIFDIAIDKKQNGNIITGKK